MALGVACLMGCSQQTSAEFKQVDQGKEAKLAFTCTQEADRLPPRDPQAEQWFKRARAMEKADGPKDFATIGALYRQAGAKDHPMALRNLQNLIRTGLVAPLPGKRPSEEVIEIVEHMIKLNIPAGYYAMGVYLERGYGVEADKMASLAYFRKAADLGSPDGQYAIGKLFLTQVLPDGQDNPTYRPDIGKKMLECSINQGFNRSAEQLAMYYDVAEKNYPMAVKYYHISAKLGGRGAYKLSEAFKSPASDGLYYLNLPQDLERTHRYKLIADEIDSNPSARFPDIDKIVPLPPAPLPDWDGTFEYKKQQEQ